MGRKLEQLKGAIEKETRDTFCLIIDIPKYVSLFQKLWMPGFLAMQQVPYVVLWLPVSG